MHEDTQNTSSEKMADIQTMRDTSKYNNINTILHLILKTRWEGAWIGFMCLRTGEGGELL